ncbi:TPA: FKBP-type peptidyl-prolyl cis-trans isomerase, partial [Morganella morganii]
QLTADKAQSEKNAALLNDKNADLAKVTRSLTDTEQKLKNAETEKQKLADQLAGQNKDAAAQSDKLKKELSTLAADKTALEKQITQLNAKNTDNAKMAAQLQTLEKELQLREADKLKLTAQLQSREADNTRQSDNLKKEVAALTVDKATLEQKIAQLTADKQLLSAKVSGADKESSTVQADNTELNKKLAAEQQRAAQLDKALKEKTQQIEALAKSDAELIKLNTQLDNQKKQLADKDAELAKAAAKLKENADLTAKYTALQKEMDKQKAVVSAQRTENTMLNTQIAKAEEKNKAVTAYTFQQVGELNKRKNQELIARLERQNYSKMTPDVYYRITKQGQKYKALKGKTVTFAMHEELTDGKVTVSYPANTPAVIPFNELPGDLAKFVSLAGAGGAVDVYIKPEGGYGVAGIEGQIPPNSMSMIKLNVLKIE